MRKIIFVLTLVTAVGIFSGCKESTQNIMAEKLSKPPTPKDLKGVNKPDLPDSKDAQERLAPKGAPESSPGILFILYNDPGQAAWSPSLWWSYHHTNTGLRGC
jgi:hypothetical protein